MLGKNIGLVISPIMTKGIKDVGKWIHYCPGCKASYQRWKRMFNLWNSALKRKLLK